MIIEDKAKKTMWAHQTKDFTKKKPEEKKYEIIITNRLKQYMKWR